MSEQFEQHKLTVVFYADVAGYSRLTRRDESGTHKRVMETLDQASNRISKGGGNVLRYAGDAILADFPSVLQAVQTAIDIQTGLADQNSDVAVNDRIEIRIGLNIGEVMQDRGEIFGDGVNLAARLEATARPGGICVSDIVYDQVKGKLDACFDDGGETRFKNIDSPVQIYHWIPDRVSSRVQHNLELPKKPSIAILAFENMSSDPEQDFFAEGISEDIITELSKFRSLFVIARNSAFAFKGRPTEIREIGQKLGVRYIVEGSVRRAGNRIRITAQLIDAIEDKHLWAERYDRDLEDIFMVQDEVTQAIVTTIEPELINSERQRARRKPTANLTAWEAYQRGLWHIYQYRQEDTRIALDLMHKAIQIDPGFAAAHGAIAFSMYVHVIMGGSNDRESDLNRGLEAGKAAVALDDRDPFAHVGLGRVQIARAEHELAIASFDRALELNPSFALAHYGKGHSQWHCGYPDRALEQFDEAMRLSPRDPLSWTFLASKSIALFMQKHYDEALECARRAQQYPVTAIWAFMGELATLGTLERSPETEAALSRALQMQPDLNMGFIRQALPITHAASAEHFYGGLIRAGIPE